MSEPKKLGDLEIVRRLADGAMATVYEVRMPAVPGSFAAKVLSSTSERARERFRREGVLVARLRHPGIVTAHRAGELPDGRPYLVFELVEGEDLGQRIEREGALPQDRAVDIALQVSRALAVAHAQGIVHRDVKPANVLLGAEGRILLADFGVATAGDLDRLTQTGQIVGTPLYMAREQLAKEGEVGPWTDVHGVGLLLYEMLTGENPFGSPGAGMHALPRVHSLTPPPVPGVTRSLSRVVARCLAKEIGDRYADAGALVEALEGISSAEARQRPLLALLLVLALVPVLGLAAWFGFQGSVASVEPPEPTRPPGTPAPVETPTPRSASLRSLGWRLSEGDVLRYWFEEARELVEPNEPEPTLQAKGWNAVHRVVRATPQDVELVGTIEAVRFQEQRAMVKYSFDSERDGPDNPMAMIGKLVGGPFSVGFDPGNGRVLRVKNVDRIREEYAKESSKDSGDAFKAVLEFSWPSNLAVNVLLSQCGSPME